MGHEWKGLPEEQPSVDALCRSNPVSLETISDGVDRGLAERNFLLGGLMKSSPSDAR